MADFNCNLLDTSHRYTRLLLPLMEKYDLMSSFEVDVNFNPDTAFTRYDRKTKSYSLIDGILISKDLKSKVSRISICHDGNNVSDHIPVELDLVLNVQELKSENIRLPLYVNWKKLSSEQKTIFSDKMTENLANIHIPPNELLHGDKCCQENGHVLALENYFDNIVAAVLQAESVLPKTNPNIQRSFWNEDLMDLKQASIDCNTNWKNMGCPKSGPVYECRKRCHYTYKSAIRKSKAESREKTNGELYEDLTSKNGVAFWKKWNSINKAGNIMSSRINGETEEQGIANEFANYFQSVYSGSDSSVYSNLKEKFHAEFHDYYDTHINDNISPYYATWSDMLDIAAKIKLGKATAGLLRPEHFLFGSVNLLCHLQILFNGMLQHSYVPSAFLAGVITPIVKDSQGDVSSTANYRGITLSCLPAKLFEFLIQKKTSHLIGTDDLQFGFKSQTSTSHAIFTLQSVVDHFNQRGSKVYVAFLDCTKAFDRISHHGLFSKLIERRVPLCILICLVYWYSNMLCSVRWGAKSSQSFSIPLGIKQGGINSPEFFSCYFNGLTNLLRSKKIGCHLYKLFLAIILFADDICLLAPTCSALERLIEMCADYCNNLGLTFNSKKSKILVFSKSKVDLSTIRPIRLGNRIIDYVSSIRYLGVTITSDRGFGYSASDDLRTFYRASNSILNVLLKPDKDVLMHLLTTNCVPILSYACSIKSFSARDMSDCNTAMNNAIRKIFTFKRWESIRSLREAFGLKSIYEIFSEARKKFLDNLVRHPNSILRILSNNLSLD